MNPQPDAERPPPATGRFDWLPYVAPLAAYLILTSMEGYLPRPDGRPDPFWYPIAYAIKIGLVLAVVWACRSTWRDLRPWPGTWTALASIGIGLLIAVLWVGIDPYTPRFSILGNREGFNPRALAAGPRVLFLLARGVGLVLLIPLIEELFYRSFLIRWLVDPDFQRVPIGRGTLVSAGVSAVLFASTHPEWLAALLTGLIWSWWVGRTKSVSACVVSHAAANVGLAIYTFWTDDWSYL